MRFDLQSNVLCLAYQHPLLWERSRGWTPKNHFLAADNPQRPPLENGRTATTIEPGDLYRFEGEGGLAAPAPAPRLISIPLENTVSLRSDVP